MQKEYIGSVDSRHNLTKYTLSNGVEVILNEDELDELFRGSPQMEDINYITTENEKLETQKEFYRGLILDFKSVINQMEKVK